MKFRIENAVRCHRIVEASSSAEAIEKSNYDKHEVRGVWAEEEPGKFIPRADWKCYRFACR